MLLTSSRPTPGMAKTVSTSTEPPKITPTPTPILPNYILITSTPTPETVFAAATQALEATALAQRNGTPTQFSGNGVGVPIL